MRESISFEAEMRPLTPAEMDRAVPLKFPNSTRIWGIITGDVWGGEKTHDAIREAVVPLRAWPVGESPLVP